MRKPLMSSLLVLAAACGGSDDPAGPIDRLPRALTVSEQEVIDRSNAFGFDLLARVSAAEEGPNVFLSPLSASMVLGMVQNGASGETYAQMTDALRTSGLTEAEINESYRSLLDLLSTLDPRVEMGIANAVYAKDVYGVEPAFAQRAETYFGAQVSNVSFTDPAALGLINGWVKDRTGGRIEKILEELPANVAILLLNAVYFRGDWTTRFDPDRTQNGPFTRADGSTVDVPLMFEEDLEVRYMSNQRLRAAELPYGGGAFRMVVVVPEGETTVGELVSELDDAAWAEMLEVMQPQPIVVQLPRFEIRYAKLLNEPLMAMGMQLPFRTGADFSRMMPELQCLSFVLQKTYVKVDEAGTTAAAVTIVGGIDSLPPGIYATRPFLFAIREALTGTILFIGTLGDPTVLEEPPTDPPPAGCPG